MKVAVIVGVLSALLIGEVGSAQAQALKKPGFEAAGQTLPVTTNAPDSKAQISGTIAETWSDNTSWADVRLEYSLSAINPHGGRHSQKIEIKRGFAQFAQAVDLPGGYSRASVWLRAESSMWVSFSLRQQGAPYTAYATQTAQIGKLWTRIETRGFVPPNTPAFLLINAASTGTIFLDDAELAPTTPRPIALKPPVVAVPRTFFGMNINHMHDEGSIPWPAVPGRVSHMGFRYRLGDYRAEEGTVRPDAAG